MAFDLCIVIPCYNESDNFLFDDYVGFISQHPDTLICMVNDGSRDDTQNRINELKSQFPDQVVSLPLGKNVGKAEAVRTGINHCCEQYSFGQIAYLDADLAVSLQECYSMKEYFDQHIVFCFGSRILLLGSVIVRRYHRFIIGRMMATLISTILNLKVYDTQCGCKVLDEDLAKQVFDRPFISKWLFDVEIFFRILAQFGKDEALEKMLEVPVKRWIDRGDSKVKPTYFLKLWLDLLRIKRAYSKQSVG